MPSAETQVTGRLAQQLQFPKRRIQVYRISRSGTTELSLGVSSRVIHFEWSGGTCRAWILETMGVPLVMRQFIVTGDNCQIPSSAQANYLKTAAIGVAGYHLFEIWPEEEGDLIEREVKTALLEQSGA